MVWVDLKEKIPAAMSIRPSRIKMMFSRLLDIACLAVATIPGELDAVAATTPVEDAALGDTRVGAVGKVEDMVVFGTTAPVFD
jgi:hypothetical protein